ncbi:MAG: hypothetical protein ABI579_09325 [Candidatus Sumerlaeota bacterium]
MTPDQQHVREETILLKKSKIADSAMNTSFIVGIVIGAIATIALIYTKWF